MLGAVLDAGNCRPGSKCLVHHSSPSPVAGGAPVILINSYHPKLF